MDMATNSEILKLLETIANGSGIQGIRSDIQGLKEDMGEVKTELKEIKDHGFSSEDSLRSRLVLAEKSIENIKLYELTPIKEKLSQRAKIKTTIEVKVIGAVVVLLLFWMIGKSFGIVVG